MTETNSYDQEINRQNIIVIEKLFNDFKHEEDTNLRKEIKEIIISLVGNKDKKINDYEQRE